MPLTIPPRSSPGDRGGATTIPPGGGPNILPRSPPGDRGGGGGGGGATSIPQEGSLLFHPALRQEIGGSHYYSPQEGGAF